MESVDSITRRNQNINMENQNKYEIVREEFDLSQKIQARKLEKIGEIRKHLYIFSIISIFMEWTGALPKEISGLGIKFDSIDQNNFLLLMAAICLYYLIIYTYESLEFRYLHIEIRRIRTHLNRLLSAYESKTSKNDHNKTKHISQDTQLWKKMRNSIGQIIYMLIPILIASYATWISVSPTLLTWIKSS